MRKVTKIVSKEETTDVCDVCESESLVITWDAYYSCPSDGCYDDRNVYHFCSFKHLLEGVAKDFAEPGAFGAKKKTALGVHDIASNYLYLTIKGEGISDVTDFLFALRDKATVEEL